MTDTTQDDDLETKLEDTTQTQSSSLAAEHEALVEQAVAERLKKMKANVDKAYEEREKLTKELAKAKSEAAAKERKALEDGGKHLEAAQLKIVELEEIVKSQTAQLTRLTRDAILDKHLSPLPFRNDSAKNAALREVVENLVQDDDGTWVHRSGTSLQDYIKAFAKDPDKEFFFKPKENLGSGTSGTKGTVAGQRPQSLKGLSTEELLKAAAAGQLGAFPQM